MTISDKSIEEFQRLFQVRYGKEISKEKAYAQGLKLLRFLKQVYQPMTEEAYDAIQERRVSTLPEVLKRIALQDTDVIV